MSFLNFFRTTNQKVDNLIKRLQEKPSHDWLAVLTKSDKNLILDLVAKEDIKNLDKLISARENLLFDDIKFLHIHHGDASVCDMPTIDIKCSLVQAAAFYKKSELIIHLIKDYGYPQDPQDFKKLLNPESEIYSPLKANPLISDEQKLNNINALINIIKNNIDEKNVDHKNTMGNN